MWQASTMDRAALKTTQDTIKADYRSHPENAMVTLRAEGSLGEGITCSVQTGQALAQAGLHPATGGDGLSLCSGDMLLQALAACAGVTLQAVATSMDVPIRSGRVDVEGDIDFRGTLSVDRDVAVGFQAIRLVFRLDTDASAEQLATLQRLTERFCVVFQTISAPPSIEVVTERS
jgi:uncharacterized OsmC-like protein